MAKKRLCSVPGCDKPHDSRGYCGAHAQRFRRHGDPLAGGTPNYEPMKFYTDTVLTNNSDECLIWPFARDAQGYAKMHVGPKNRLVARMLCEETNGPPPTQRHEAAHSCGKGMGGCVNRWHLSWKTHRENEADKLLHGTDQFGERNPIAKLTQEQADQIRKIGKSMAQRKIAAQFGVSQSLISLILRGEIWATGASSS